MIDSILKGSDIKKRSFWKLFRVFFVLFSLYLMGDAFSRWDGFSYYAPFSVFLPSIALVSILWSFVAFLTSVMVWVQFKIIEWLSSRAGWKIKIEYYLLWLGIFGLLGSVFWISKKIIWPDLHSFLFKLISFFCLSLIAVIATWLLRTKAERCISIIQERITPLIWLFGIIVIFSVPLVAYHMWFKGDDKKVLKQITQQTANDKNRPNFIVVTFDALTARDMSSHGYYRETTPFISEWAKSATLFKWTESAATYTAPALTSLMTGKNLWSHYSYYSEGISHEKNNENLAQVLKNNGYHTRVYMGNRFATPKALGMESSYDFVQELPAFRMISFSILGVIDEFLSRFFLDKIPLYDWIIKEDFLLYKILWVSSPGVSKELWPPERAFNDFIGAMERGEIPEPYFVWIHFYPPHAAYLPPDPYMGMFNPSPESRSEKSQQLAEKTIQKEYPINPERARSMSNIFNLLRDRYDETIRFCDKQFGDFMVRLDAKNVLTNSIIILSSDHGESFEHGYIGHGSNLLYEPETHIPLFIKERDQHKGYIVNDIVGQIDITATILDLAGVPVPSWMDGRSFVPLMRGQKLLPRYTFSMNLDRNPSRKKVTKGTIAVWEGDYKLIHYLEKSKSLLFNLKEDPDELNDLFHSEPEIGQHLLNLIRYDLKKANDRITGD